MTKTSRSATTACFLLFVLLLPSARANDFADLDCFTWVAQTGYATQRIATPEVTAVGSGTETLSAGYDFSHTDDEEIWCQWTVPDNYD